MTTVDRTY